MAKTYSDFFSQLAPHKEFDPAAFVGNKKIPQELCNFILALTLAYNDFKHYTMSFIMLIDSQPKGNPQRNSLWGEHVGVKLHIIRLHIAFVHELFQLIRDSKRVLSHPFFIEVIRVLNKKARASWDLLLEAALAKETASKRTNPLLMIRNKVIFHYDAKELFAGYRKGFFRDGKSLQRACISDGLILWNSRFYFADLAIQGYLEKELGSNADGFYASLSQIMEDINMALYSISTRFIQRRGFAWFIPRA